MKIEIDFDLIDGNVSKNVIGYCKRYHAFLTSPLAAVHQCLNKNCDKYMSMDKCFEFVRSKFSGSIQLLKIKSFKE